MAEVKGQNKSNLILFMALYAKYDVRPENENGYYGYWSDEQDMRGVAPARMDEMLLDALEALEQTRRLHESTPNPETKRLARRIIENLQSSLNKLAPLGVHSARRLEQMAAAR